MGTRMRAWAHAYMLVAVAVGVVWADGRVRAAAAHGRWIVKIPRTPFVLMANNGL